MIKAMARSCTNQLAHKASFLDAHANVPTEGRKHHLTMFTGIHPMCSTCPRRRERMSAITATVIHVKPWSALNFVMPRFSSLMFSTQQDYGRAERGLARSTAWTRKATVTPERLCAIIQSATSFKSSSINRVANAALLPASEPAAAMFRISKISTRSNSKARPQEHAHQLWDTGAGPDLLNSCIHVES